jgi:type IX secretion system PorP/SprF family membrane protein
MKKIIILSLFVILPFVRLQAQDMHFSILSMVPMQIDPSQTGKYNGDQRAIVNYRTQWSSISNPYNTYGFSFDTKLSKKENFLAAGICLYNDRAGSINMGFLNVNASVAYHFKTGRKSYFAGGIQGGIFQRNIDQTKLEFDNQFDGTGFNPTYSSNENITNPAFIQPDFSGGISYFYKDLSNRKYEGLQLNVGLSVQHVNSPYFSFINKISDKQALKFIGYTTNTLGLNKKLAIEPAAYFTYQQGATDFVAGANFKYALKSMTSMSMIASGGSLNFGVYFRTIDALIITTIYEMGSLAVALSYDINVSGLNVASNGRGGFEMAIRFLNPNPYHKSIGIPRY